MDLNRDAMLVGLRIPAWSGRLYDREASDHVAAHHDALASAGRYENSLPWDDKGGRLLTVANYEHYTGLMDGLREALIACSTPNRSAPCARASALMVASP